jgi:hypothetical protein
MKTLTADVEQLAADNKDIIGWFASGKDCCIPTVVVEFCQDLEAAIRQNQEREEKLKKATERKKRGKLKSKETGTSTKKKDLMPGRKKVDEEASEEEIEEVIEEVSGSGSDIEEVIEEVEEITDSESDD